MKYNNFIIHRKCPNCSCHIVARIRRPLLIKLFSSQKHYICRACHTRFKENGTIIKLNTECINLVLTEETSAT